MRGAAGVRGGLLAGVLAAAALPAGAQAPVGLAPAFGAALEACLAEAAPLAARAAALEAAGWLALPPGARDPAVAALAPLQAIAIGRVFLPDGPNPAPEAAAEALAQAAGQLAQAAAWDSPRNLWFALPDGAGHLRLFDPLGAPPSTRCELAGPVAAPDLAAVLGAPEAEHALDRLAVAVFALPAGRLELFTPAEGAFGAGQPLGALAATPIRGAP